jgi:hypothetical protein
MTKYIAGFTLLIWGYVVMPKGPSWRMSLAGLLISAAAITFFWNFRK